MGIPVVTTIASARYGYASYHIIHEGKEMSKEIHLQLQRVVDVRGIHLMLSFPFPYPTHKSKASIKGPERHKCPS